MTRKAPDSGTGQARPFRTGSNGPALIPDSITTTRRSFK